MQELTHGCAAAPAGHAGGFRLDSLVKAADQGRQDMAVGGVVVVARAIEIGGHKANSIKTVLKAQGLAKLDAGDLGDRIPRITGLQGPGEQRFLADGLFGELRVDAAATQKKQAPHPREPGRFDHVGLDLEVI